MEDNTLHGDDADDQHDPICWNSSNLTPMVGPDITKWLLLTDKELAMTKRQGAHIN